MPIKEISRRRRVELLPAGVGMCFPTNLPTDTVTRGETEGHRTKGKSLQHKGLEVLRGISEYSAKLALTYW